MTQPIPRVPIQEKLSSGKRRLRGLPLAAVAAMLGAMTCVSGAGAATRIDSCRTLSTAGETYVLNNDLSGCDSCLVVNADRITIDLAGHAISGILGACDGSAGVTDGGTVRQGVTVKNGTISNFTVGVALGSSTRNQILNLTSSANSEIGINVGVRSLVKGCVVEDNGGYGIIIGEFGQVQDCTIIGHDGGFGIFGAGHLLVKDNDVADNLAGIVVGDFGTVAFNSSNNNAVSGLFAGDHSLVTGNTTTGNGNAGITAAGLSAISYNVSSDNGGGGIAVGVDGVFDGTQSLVTGNTTNNNGGVGVDAACPSTVTNNRSSGNGLNYDITGPGCRTNNNR